MSLCLLLLLSAAPDAGPPVAEFIRGGKVFRASRELMHTRVSLAFADPPAQGLSDHELDFGQAFGVFERIDQQMNEWREGSALWSINAAAGKEPVAAPKDLCEVIALALDGARRTDGLFDPTWAALADLWRFGSEEDGVVPDRAQVAERCKLVSYKDVELKPLPRPTAELACTVRLKKAGMRLGLGGVVKGWGVDQVARLWRAKGYRNFFIQAGGDLYLAGKVGDRPWRGGIRDPRGPPEQSFARMELSDTAFSTSGDYEHFFVKDGVRYHHIIDLRDCWPARASVSSTVLAKTATDAEFLTKATFVLGPVEGLKLAKRFGASVVLVDSKGGVHFSPELKGRLTWWPPSGFAPDGGVPDAGVTAPGAR